MKQTMRHQKAFRDYQTAMERKRPMQPRWVQVLQDYARRIARVYTQRMEP